MEFIAATNNPSKMKEMRRILERMGHTVQSQREAGIQLEPKETGVTFAENAHIKALAICKAGGKATIADDSGLCVDALNGAPGVYSARYCGHHGDDEANNDKLLQEMQGVPPDKRGCRFISNICIALPNGDFYSFEGCCLGHVGIGRKGTNGFGYDPLFNVDYYGGRSYAELTDDEKDEVSHRGAALRQMEALLPALMVHQKAGSAKE